MPKFFLYFLSLTIKAAEGDWLMCGCEHYCYLSLGASHPSHFAGPYLIELFAMTQDNQSMYL